MISYDYCKQRNQPEEWKWQNQVIHGASAHSWTNLAAEQTSYKVAGSVMGKVDQREMASSLNLGINLEID